METNTCIGCKYFMTCGDETRTATCNGKEVVSDVVEHYGTTTNLELAGWLLPNGKMLDFSEGQDMRILDHRDIKDFDPNYTDGNGTISLIRFMNNGNIRVNCFHDIYGFDIPIEEHLTEAQYKVMRRAERIAKARGIPFYIDCSDHNGIEVRTIDSVAGL